MEYSNKGLKKLYHSTKEICSQTVK